MATKKISPNEQTKTVVAALVPVLYDNVLVALGDTFEVREADLPQLLEVAAVVVVPTP